MRLLTQMRTGRGDQLAVLAQQYEVKAFAVGSSNTTTRTNLTPEAWWEKYFSIGEKITRAARSFGKPKIPVDIAGREMERTFSSSAISREPWTAETTFASSPPEPQTGPTAWSTIYAPSSPAEVQAGCECDT